MKVGLIYRNIAVTGSGLAGGGDVFVVYLLKALKENGHKVVLLTTQPTNWNTIKKDLGWVYKPDEEGKCFALPDFEGMKLYRQFLPAPYINSLKKNCDITFNAYGNNPFWNTDLIYMHTPVTKQELEAKYSRNLFTRSYFALYKYLMKRSIKKLKTTILTNSEYSREIIRSTLGRDAKVVYPPVDTAKYRSALNKYSKRENWVVIVSRYTWERNLHLIPVMAKEIKEATFHIIGNTALTYASKVIEDIGKRSSELGVSDRVHIHVNIPFSEKLEILAKAKVYVNTLKEEHFGMSIAEAMSAGLIPILPNEGGQREILPGEEFLYDNLEDAVNKIRFWLKEWSNDMANRISRSAERFSYERFKEEIEALIEATVS
ncbi:MAG TPA: glycosyltransferase family 4 protein [archaeon]|nr:glycosyltransferase family 4 protein [archaeon]